MGTQPAVELAGRRTVAHHNRTTIARIRRLLLHLARLVAALR